MKIAVVCANGKEGQLIVKEAQERGHEVTAVVRGENRSAAKNAIVKDLFDLTTSDLQDFDVVVNAFGAWTPETIPQIAESEKHLADILEGTGVRFLMVGGAGSLFTNAEHTQTVDMGPDFPDDWKPLSASHGKALADLRGRTQLSWTYVSPACDFQADGERTGRYLLGGEELLVNERGESIISYADYAIAMVDEAENAAHVNERIGVVRA